jgi:Fe-S-cluster-containing dehydrogenase component
MAEKKYGMVIDVFRCTGCYNCFFACKDENCGEAHPGYTEAQPMTGQFWINVLDVERGSYPKVRISHIPVTCGQCENPLCLKSATDGAVYRRDDGIIMIDPVKAVGQKQLVNACPHRVIFWNEEKNLPQKCDMCAHFLDEGFPKPRCVETCPTGALVFGDLNDPNSEVSKLMNGPQKPYSRHPEFELDEKVLYLNVPKKFVAGSIVDKATDQCAKDVKVTLKGADGDKTVQTDIFGDFWFHDLPSMTRYKLEITAPGYKPISMDVRTQGDVVLEEIMIEKTA